MKKAKILVPAMGMMLLSTAAAVSGTMAWFTANRAVSVSTTDFTIQALDGNFVVTATDIEGVTIANNVVSPKGNMGDASYDHVNGIAYTDIPKDDGSQPDTYKSVGTLAAAAGESPIDTDAIWKVGSTTMYYAVAWNLHFEYTFAGDTSNLNLFFNIHDASFTPTTGTGTATTHTANGFRLALIAPTKTVIWAPGRASADASDVKYVNSTTTTTTYAANTVIYSDNAEAVKADGAANTTIDYLGQITSSSNTIDVKCVAWFEGTDPDVINESTMDKVKATLPFYVRKA